MIICYTLPPNPSKRYESESGCVVFGRKPKTGQYIDIDLQPDCYVSHVHARLTYEDDCYWVEDLESENGTWVEDRKIEGKIKVPHGAKIRIGWTIIEIEGKPPAASPPPPDPEETVVKELDVKKPSRKIKDKPKTDFKDEQEGIAAPEETVVKKLDVKKPSRKIKDIPKTDFKDEQEGIAAPEVTIYSSPSKPLKQPAPKGTITSVRNAFTPPFSDVDEDVADDSQKQTWNKLKALNNFIQALGSARTIEDLGQTLVEQLRLSIPHAQRGALLLPDQDGELLLKAHWPMGEHSVSMTFVNRAFSKHEAFIWSASPPSETADEDEAPKSAIYYDVQSAIYLPLLSSDEALGVMYVDNYLTREAFSPLELELLRAISNQVAMFLRDHVLRQDLQREEELRSNLLRQYSPKVADQILKKSDRLKRGGEQVEPVTILVSDIRGFTAISAQMEPDEVVRSINEMFDAFVPIITEMDGVVDKYVGDSVLAVFGSPEQDPHQWEKAVKAAIKMQEAMRMLAEGRKVRRLPVFRVGIGIHTGEVIHGFIGSSERIEFTVIGDTVNRAARFCDGAGPDEVVISKKVFERVYQFVSVHPKTIVTKHPDREPDLDAYVVEGLKE